MGQASILCHVPGRSGETFDLPHFTEFCFPAVAVDAPFGFLLSSSAVRSLAAFQCTQPL